MVCGTVTALERVEHQTPRKVDNGLRRRGPSIAHLVFCAFAALPAENAGAQTPALLPVSVVAETVDTVELHEGFLYTSAGRTITVYDLSKPSAPVLRGAFTFPEEVWSFTIDGRYAFVGANFFGLGILDISDPAKPTLVGSFKTPGQAKAAAVAHGKAAVIDHMEGLVFVDVTDPTKPVGLGTYFLDGYARDVVTSGSMAYAADSPSGLYVVDLSKAAPLEPIGTTQSGTGFRTLAVSPGTGDGTARLAALTGGGLLQVYDIAKTSAPTRLSTLKMPGSALRVALRGQRAYVADGAAGLQIVDLSNPSAPSVMASHSTAAAARDVAVGDGLVVVATADSIVLLRDLP